MGEYLGIGAHMKELRRTKAGPIREEDNIISLDKLRNLYELYKETNDDKEKKIFEKELKKYIRPMEELLKDIKKIYLKDSTINSISHGGDLAIPGIYAFDENIELGEEVALMSGKGELVAMGISMLSSKEIEKKSKGFLCKVNKVFIEPDIYPKINNFQKKEN
jgi:H/ACA ribonucleoprotein complex subunit 4